MKKRNYILRTLTFLILCSFTSVLYADQQAPSRFLPLLNSNLKALQGSEQVIIVAAESASSQNAYLYTFYKTKKSWNIQFIPLYVSIGAKGFSAADEKTEGDMRTPAGIFKIVCAAGNDAGVDTKLAYIPHLAGDSHFVETGNVSPERMSDIDPAKLDPRERRDSYLYKLSLLFQCGDTPGPPRAGFVMKLWHNQKYPTCGSIAISELNMLKLLKWLDKDKNPVLIAGPAEFVLNLK